jgi:hypothetical protein
MVLVTVALMGLLPRFGRTEAGPSSAGLKPEFLRRS